MLAKDAKRRSNTFWEGTDLVMEVVSEDNRTPCCFGDSV